MFFVLLLYKERGRMSAQKAIGGHYVKEKQRAENEEDQDQIYLLVGFQEIYNQGQRH